METLDPLISRSELKPSSTFPSSNDLHIGGSLPILDSETEVHPFQHYQSAHCESGVISNLLRNAGLPVSEAMAFGIGSGIFFAHVPFVKVMGLPLTSYRSMPGGIFEKTCKRLGVSYSIEKFTDPVVGRRALDAYADAGKAVGLRSNIYWLPYIPEKFRFQFNAHNLIVYGRDANSDYLVSDPVMETASKCAARDLDRGRFAKGVLAPKGAIFYPNVTEFNLDHHDLAAAVRAGIQESVNRNLRSFLFFGNPGVHYLSRRMRKWPKAFKKDEGQIKLNLANIVRMQEEIGTGGAGFRYLFAAFLQESADRLELPALGKAAREFTDVGNKWREFATEAARFCKGRFIGSFQQLPDMLVAIAEQEKASFEALRRDYLNPGH